MAARGREGGGKRSGLSEAGRRGREVASSACYPVLQFLMKEWARELNRRSDHEKRSTQVSCVCSLKLLAVRYLTLVATSGIKQLICRIEKKIWIQVGFETMILDLSTTS